MGIDDRYMMGIVNKWLILTDDGWLWLIMATHDASCLLVMMLNARNQIDELLSIVYTGGQWWLTEVHGG